MNEYNKAVYINVNDFIDNFSEGDYIAEPFASLLDDRIKYFSKNFWITQNGKLVNAENIGEKFINIESVEDNVLLLKSNKYYFLEEVTESNGFIKKTFSVNKWNIFINSIIDTYKINFFDDNFIIEEPTKLYEKNSIEKNNNYVNREFVYNFFVEKYDSLALDKNLDIRTIPDIISYIEKNKNKLSYDNFITENEINYLLDSKEENNNLKNYFSKIFDAHKEKQFFLETLKNINNIFPVDALTNQKIKNINFVPFPYYSDIVFKNNANNKEFLINYINNFSNLKQELYAFLNSNLETKKINYIYGKDSLQNKSVNVFNLKNFLELGLSGPKELLVNGNTIPDDNYRPFRQLEYADIVRFITKKLKNTHYNFYKNKKINNLQEILFYKIEKRRFSHDTEEPIQTFWIYPDSSDYFRVLDTQLKYGENYYYKIFAYVLNIGAQYSYDNYYTDDLERQTDLNNGLYKIKILSNPTYNIYELEISRFHGAVHENPPTKPKISFKEEAKTVSIQILDSAEEEYEEYKVINDKDFKTLENIKISQENDDKNKIKYKKNRTKNYIDLEIYKTTIKPTDYYSLEDKKYKTIRIDNKTFFNDLVVPNIKYYYIFRYLNFHKAPSNPTEVFEVELKDEEGYYYLNVNPINLDNKINKKTYKDLKRYLLIRPSIIQLQKKKSQPDTVDNLLLGPDGKNIWSSNENKTFIIRITSKKSNRVLEFDLGAIINRKKE